MELSWRVVLEAASASGANPRTCRGADSGFPCFSAEGGTCGSRGGGGDFCPTRNKAQEWTVDHAPLPQFLDETVELRLVPQGRVQQSTVEHVSVPQVLDVIEVVLPPHERGQQQTAQQFVDVPQILEEHVGVVRLVPQGRMQRVGEQIVEVSIPQISEHNEQIVDVSVPQEQIAEVIPLTPHEIQQMNKPRS